MTCTLYLNGMYKTSDRHKFLFGWSRIIFGLRYVAAESQIVTLGQEYIDIRKVSEGILTNLIPQLIKAGEKIGTVILEDGKEEPIIAEEDITIEAGTPVAVKMYARRGIIDERTPLFR